MPSTTTQASSTLRVLRGVTVVDTRDGSLTPDSDVTVAGGTITAIAPTDPTARIDLSTAVVEARGQYLVPGFLDMHAHPLGEKKPTGALELMLANGITGFRQMAGSTDLLEQRRAGRLPLPADSPAVVALPGALLTPLNASRAPDAVAAAREQHAAGADFLKVGLVTSEVFFAILSEAARLGIPVAGHVPEDIDVAAASRAGVRCIEHLGPGVAILAACSSDQAGITHAVATLPSLKLPSVKLPFMDRILTRILRKIVVNPLARAKPGTVQIRQRAIDTFDEGRALLLAAQFVADGTCQCPTLIRVRTQQRCDASEFRSDPALAYMAPSTVKTWNAVADTFAKLPDDAKATFRVFYDLQLQLTKLFDDAGVKMLAGSDTVGAAWVVPGFSLHREFDELARAGLSPLRILQMTTLHGAEFLGTTATMGTVDVGKDADLVLLGANPIEDAAHLHQIAGVVRRGRHYSTPDLDRIKDRVKTSNPAY